MRRVSRISIAPVKGFALVHPDEVELGPDGVAGNRRFYVVEPDGTRLRSSKTDWLCRFRAEYDAAAEVLRVRLPEGREVEGSAAANGQRVRSDFNGREVEAALVDGPWTEALSAEAGKPVRLARVVRPATSYDHVVSIMSEASLDRLAEQAGQAVDGRRFRMLLTLAGCEAHEEDGWNGRLLRVGETVLRAGGPIERCAVTTRDPDTGERDLDTLRLIKDYRGVSDGQSIDFGVYADVVEPGRVRVGDSVELV
jgi:uncharacterized protein YcbX